MKARRRAWFDGQPDLDPAKLVFIDETSASTKMARLCGRAKKGERCRAAVPHGHWKTTTFTAGLRLDGLAAPMLLDGAMNGPAFLAYVEQVLVPELAPGDIVIMPSTCTSPLSGAFSLTVPSTMITRLFCRRSYFASSIWAFLHASLLKELTLAKIV